MAQGRPSKASLILLAHNVTVTELAEELGVSTQAISLHLNGNTNEAPRALVKAIGDRLGPAAYDLWDAVNAAREARQEASA